MSDKSKIAWCDATWQVVAGCTPVGGKDSGCANCYSARLCATRLKHLPWADGLAEPSGKWTGKVITRPDQLDVPLRWRRPRKIFVGDRGDLFHPKVPFELIAAVFGVMAACPQHQFLVLTKRPERMLEFLRWAEKRGEDGKRLFPEDPQDWRIRQLLNVSARRAGVDMNAHQNHGGSWPLPNVWLGTSVENQKAADERIPALLQCPAKVHFLSFEPLLEPIQLKETPDWGIIGCESGHNRRRCDPLWMKYLIRKLRADGSRIFVKQVDMGTHVSHDPAEWPESLRVQEFPEVEP